MFNNTVQFAEDGLYCTTGEISERKAPTLKELMQSSELEGSQVHLPYRTRTLPPERHAVELTSTRLI